MQKGNINSAMKLLTNNISGGILPLNKETLQSLKQKHPDTTNCHEDIALHGPIKPIHPIVYEEINEDLVLKSCKIDKRWIWTIWNGCRWLEEAPSIESIWRKW